MRKTPIIVAAARGACQGTFRRGSLGSRGQPSGLPGSRCRDRAMRLRLAR